VKTLIIYDSVYGNTEKIAQAIGAALGSQGEVETLRGGELCIPPEGFFVEGTEGPLKEGELKRAAEWAKPLIQG
jgi:hypothetical protein